MVDFQASNALPLAQSNFLTGIETRRWKISRNQVNYLRPDTHTLSMYIKGGETSYRSNHSTKKGRPKALCQMPQGQASKWHINDDIEFAHLYFTDKVLKQYAAMNFDFDVRFIELQDLTYQQDAKLSNMFTEYLSISERNKELFSLASEQLLHSIFHHIVNHYNGFRIKDEPINGGLSPFNMRRIKSAIYERLHEKLTISEMAELINLSPFHFARMFKISFGISPAEFVMLARVERVKHYLAKSLPLSEISTLTGFSHQSHMTYAFKKATGTTPANYR